MSDGWQAGDLAVCVDATSPMTRRDTRLVEGRAYKVTGVRVARGTPFSSDLGTPAYLGLYLAELRSYGTTGAFDARRFRKIRPDKHEDCEPEFVELLNRIKRKVAA